MMTEKQWVANVISLLRPELSKVDSSLSISQGQRLMYAYEVQYFTDDKIGSSKAMLYETDTLVSEEIGDKSVPRLVIEAKVNSITTHDAITYSQKAFSHKQVHPYLRYGIMIGNRRHYPLPGRLFRHGAYFDFMVSWKGYEPTTIELNTLVKLIVDEVNASRQLEEILYSSRKQDRERYTVLHRPLQLW